jgi:hypothetical protein
MTEYLNEGYEGSQIVYGSEVPQHVFRKNGFQCRTVPEPI